MVVQDALYFTLGCAGDRQLDGFECCHLLKTCLRPMVNFTVLEVNKLISAIEAVNY